MLKVFSKNRGQNKMKTPQVLYRLAFLAGIGILACVLVFATEISPVRISKQRTPVEATPSVISKKKRVSAAKRQWIVYKNGFNKQANANARHRRILPDDYRQ